ncbi:unnamed protein product, partial [Amoebophrya sp. A25]
LTPLPGEKSGAGKLCYELSLDSKNNFPPFSEERHRIWLQVVALWKEKGFDKFNYKKTVKSISNLTKYFPRSVLLWMVNRERASNEHSFIETWKIAAKERDRLLALKYASNDTQKLLKAHTAKKRSRKVRGTPTPSPPNDKRPNICGTPANTMGGRGRTVYPADLLTGSSAVDINKLIIDDNSRGGNTTKNHNQNPQDAESGDIKIATGESSSSNCTTTQPVFVNTLNKASEQGKCDELGTRMAFANLNPDQAAVPPKATSASSSSTFSSSAASASRMTKDTFAQQATTPTTTTISGEVFPPETKSSSTLLPTGQGCKDEVMHNDNADGSL